VWLVVTPFVLRSTEGMTVVEMDLELYNDVAVGLLTFLLGVYSSYEARETHTATAVART
jgi:hypothetical protein